MAEPTEALTLRNEKGTIVCTKDYPWRKQAGTPAVHPDAKFTHECGDSCCDYYACPHCGHEFRVHNGEA